jgi:putative transposase
MEEKMKFVVDYELGEHSMSELCQRYQISRETGYVWLRRYRQAGLEGLLERSRAAQRHSNQTPEQIEQSILELRQAHMRWGPRKLKRVLERDQPGRVWPATSTIGTLLKREGLVVPRKKRLHAVAYTEPLGHADGANRVWCADFKGWLRTADGERIDPLTISDAHSRYLLRCQAAEKSDTAWVQAIFEAAFREYGLPEAIRTDNGAPFASPAVAGLSRLAVWWIKLGIVPERIQAGHHEQKAYASHCTSFEHCGRTEAAGWRRQNLTPWAFRGMLRPTDSYRLSGLSV